MSEQEILLVITNLPDRSVAEHIAETLVTEGMAACANVQSACTSFYRWQGKLERADEIPLLIKTTRAAYPRLESLLGSGRHYVRDCHSQAVLNLGDRKLNLSPNPVDNHQRDRAELPEATLRKFIQQQPGAGAEPGQDKPDDDNVVNADYKVKEE